MAKKTVIDYLLEHEIIGTKDEAMRHVMAGNVIGEGRKFSSLYEKLKDNEIVRLKRTNSKFVSRGGDKIASVFDDFGIEIEGKIGLDCGVSTGGFTDFLLQNGISKMITVDVGYGILDDKLRNDERVLNFDRVNIRTLEHSVLEEGLLSHKNGPIPLSLDVCVADLSFISLTNVLPNVKDLLNRGADALVLFKPQFELPRELIPDGGIITDTKQVEEYLAKFISEVESFGYAHQKSVASEVQGTKGNQEYFVHFKVKK